MKWSYVNILKNLTSDSPSVPQTPAGYSSSDFVSQQPAFTKTKSELMFRKLPKKQKVITPVLNDKILNQYELSKFKPIKIKESVLRTKSTSKERNERDKQKEQAIDQAFDIVAALLESDGATSQTA